MFCKTCNKEEEYVKIGGKVYCANCASLLSDSKEPAAVKTPEIEVDANGIQTEEVPHQEITNKPEIKEIADTTPVPAKTKDELGGSAVLLDILSDESNDLKADAEIKKDEDLIQAAGGTLDYLASVPQIPKGQSINDLSPQKIAKRDDYLGSYFKGKLNNAEKEVEKDVKKVEDTLASQKGSTNEATTIEIALILVLGAVLFISLFVLFKSLL